MERSLAVLMIGSLGLLTAGSADARPPTVNERLAEYGAKLALKKFPIWKHRDAGSIDCSGGRISRTSWTCRLVLKKGRTYRQGRALTFSTNDQSAKGPYRTKVNFGPVRRCRG